MSRRGGPGLPILLGVGVVGLFLYGFYSYHEVKSRLRAVEERADRLKVQHESVSAQLQVVYEHKTRLEKAIAEEKLQHKKTRDDLTGEKGAMEDRMRQDKETLTDEVNRIKTELDKQKDEFSRVEADKHHIEEELKTFQADCQRDKDTQLQQYNQQRQECNNDAAELKDEIADLKRRNGELETKLLNLTGPKAAVQENFGLGRNKSANEDQNLMQIAQPDENKPKAYFEVKSPAPDDANLRNGRQLPPEQQGQVIPPVVKSRDAVGDDGGAPIAVALPNGGQVDIPNRAENEIKDVTVRRNIENNFAGGARNLNENNAINQLDNVAVENQKVVGNPGPVQVPAPESKDRELPESEKAGQPERRPDEHLEQGQGFAPEHGVNAAPGANEANGAAPNEEEDNEEEPQAQNDDHQNDQADGQKDSPNEKDYAGRNPVLAREI